MNRREILLGISALLVLNACKSMGNASTPRAFIVHGYDAGVDRHWFSWLSNELKNHGMQAVIIPLPDSKHPNFTKWQQTLKQYIGTPRNDDVFVAHSLGTISLLHYLSAQRKPVHQVVLVSGFGERLPNLSRIDDFDVDAYVAQASLDDDFLSRHIDQLTHIISDNDSIVAPNMSHQLAHRLGGKTISVENGGHFLDSDGFTRLPWAYQALLESR